MTAALRVLVVAALLAVRAQTLSNGVDGHHGSAAGGERYSKLDRFLHDRMGLGGNRSEPLALSTDRSLLSRTTTTAASVAVPEYEDGGDGDDDDDDDDDEEDDDEGGRDEEEDDDDEEEEDEQLTRKTIRLRHWNSRWDDENGLHDRNVQRQEPARTMSPISENKWKLLGSRKSVAETFRNMHRNSMFQGDSEGNEAKKHQIRMSREASCKVPRPRVIKVIDVYPSSNKMYIPSCTVLHVCADDTGCCGSPTLKCGPKSTQPITLHFLIHIASGLSDRSSSSDSPYQTSLEFHNHTECECQSKTDDMMPRDMMSSSIRSAAELPPSIHRIDDNRCKCPKEYTVRYLANGSCSCDCFDKQRECIRYKKGNEYFNHMDRYCITSGQCMLPMCEYGVYSHRTGRCPKKFENFYSFKKRHYF